MGRLGEAVRMSLRAVQQLTEQLTRREVVASMLSDVLLTLVQSLFSSETGIRDSSVDYCQRRT